MDDIPQTLIERHQEWIQVVNNGDIEAYSRIMTENVVWIPPHSEPIEGREDIHGAVDPR